MDAETEKDPFASIIKFCEPTTSQEAKFPNCPLTRESENFVDSNPDQFSSSPDWTPSNPTGIVMISPPGSSGSVHQHTVEEDAVFLTPPEHHSHSHLSSSEDQNPNECCAEGLTIAEAGDGSDRTEKVRVSEAGLDDEPEAKRVRVVPGEEFEGETVPLGETEVVEIEGDEDVQDTEVVVSDNGDFGGEERATSCLAEGSLEVTGEAGTIGVVQEIFGLMKDSVAKFDAINGNHELGEKCKCVEDIRVTRGDKPNGNSDSSGRLDSDKIEGEIVRLKHIVGEKCSEVKLKSDAGGSEKVVEISKDAKIPKDIHRDGGVRSNDEQEAKRVWVVPGEEFDGETVPLGETEVVEIEGDEGVQDTSGSEKVVEILKVAKIPKDIHMDRGVRSNGKRIEEIEEFRYTGDVDGRCEGRTGRPVGGSGRRRQLPPSLNEKEKEKEVVGTSEKKSGLLDLLNVLKAVLGDTEGGCEDVDFIETAKKRGLTFPRVRWWPSEDEDWSDGLP